MKIVRYGSLLEQAHQRGIRKVATVLVQAPAEANGWTAIVSSIVEMEGGACFSGLGDASPQSVKRPLVPHIVRMAETRSKGRAFKDALGVSAVSLEELGDEDEVFEEAGDTNVHLLPSRPQRRVTPASEAQLRYLRRLFVRRGVRGDALDPAICDALGVAGIRDIDRHAASVLIDELKQAGGA